MPSNRLKYLTTPNPRVHTYASHRTFTIGKDWDPIENIEPWNEFSSFKDEFSANLKKEMERDNLTELTERARFNHVYGEPGLSQLIGAAIMMPVSMALPKDHFITSGEQVTKDFGDTRPDWGAGSEKMKTTTGNYRPLVCGDTKLGWPIVEALDMISTHPDGYEESRRNLALPLEQLQHYCLMNDTPYGFIITESHLLVACFVLSPDTTRSPRPSRSTRSHRVLSTSTVSTDLVSNFTDMSFEPSPAHRHVAKVKVSVTTWERPPDGMTVKLSLWLLIMHARDHKGLKAEEQTSGPAPKSTDEKDKASKSKGKGVALLCFFLLLVQSVSKLPSPYLHSLS